MKKILIGIILITFTAAAWTLTARITEVDQNPGVEIVMDGKTYRELKALAPEINLQQLKEKGVTALAVYQQSLEDFLDDGSLVRIEEFDIITADSQFKSEIESSGINTAELENAALFAVFSDSLRQQLNNMSKDLAAQYQVEIIKKSYYDLLYFPNWHKSLKNLNLGFNTAQLKRAEELNLKIGLRSSNELNALSALKNNLELFTGDLLIFAGEEITGYPENIAQTAELMQKHDLTFAKIEAFIAKQSGAEKLALLNNYKVLRTHSIQQEEVEKTAPREIISRYLLALRERNVKLIYHKPYLKGDNLAARNLELLASLNRELESEGYIPANAAAVDYFSNSNWHLLTVLIGVTAAAVLLLNYFTAFKFAQLMNLFFLISAAAGAGLLYSGREILLRQITALGSAVIFPSLAVIIFLVEKNRGGEEMRSGLNFAFIFFNFTAAVITALIGGVFVSSALNSSEFIFKINNFRGVKAAFLFPLLIITGYYFARTGTKKIEQKVPEFLDRAIRIKDILLVFLLALIAVIYIGRTGNFPLLPVPAWELTVRSFLERVLYVRPRFKEFLIGHPLFIFSLYLAPKKRKQLYFYPLLMLASVGVITTVNTFSHLHTPVMISLLRTFHSYWLSFAAALVIISIYKIIHYFIKNIKVSGVKK